jgi:anti-sigma regulatory factor (Ser/Thr protein kinase)
MERAIEECEGFLRSFRYIDLPKIMLVLKELLVNAVTHGCKDDPELEVRTDIRKLSETRFMVRVEDQGEGFDYRGLNLELPEDPKSRLKRGYILINALADRIHFNSKGNCITVYVDMKQGDITNLRSLQ